MNGFLTIFKNYLHSKQNNCKYNFAKYIDIEINLVSINVLYYVKYKGFIFLLATFEQTMTACFNSNVFLHFFLLFITLLYKFYLI